MKNILKILLPLFGVLFLIILILSLRTLSEFSLSQSESSTPPEYSYAIFLPPLDYPFFNNIKQGALDAAEALNCTVGFYQADLEPQSLEMISYSGVDGVAVYPLIGDETFARNLSLVSKQDLPLVFLEHTLSSSPAFFIGTNSYEVGKKIGELVRTIDRETLNCALVFSEKSPGILADSALVEMGFRKILGDQILESFYFEQTNSNPLDAENLVYRLLREYPELDTLIFTDPNDTLAAVQVIVDQNLVGKVNIVGFGDDPVIQDYIAKGIVQGSVVRDSYQIGYKAIEILKGISVNGNASAFVDIGTRLISPVNVNRYGEVE